MTIRHLLANALVALSLAAVPAIAQDRPAGGSADAFEPRVSDERLNHVMERVRGHQLDPVHGAGEVSASWRWGVPQTWLAEMVSTWCNGYDWREAEARLNRFDNFRAEIDGLALHFIHEPGSGEDPLPLLVMHGWPYSPLTFTEVIEPLAHPERFGGAPQEAFSVVVVSTPGLGWSEAPDAPESMRATGQRYHKLMTEVLGYDRYIVHGGDQGGVIAGWMAYDQPDAVIGLHQHMFYPRHASAPFMGGSAGPDASEAEQAWVADEAAAPFGQLAYILTHVARGNTLAASLDDNPVGQAAWIWDKFYWWTDTARRPFDEVHTSHRLIDEAMYYIVTDSFRTTLWPYMSMGQDDIVALPDGTAIATPTQITAWPDPVFPLPPREFVERSRSNLIAYTEPEEGGHFPMIERPDLYVEDLRAFRRVLRARSEP